MIRKAFPVAALLFALPCLAMTKAPAKKPSTVHTTTHAASNRTTASSHARKSTKQGNSKQTAASSHHQPAAMDTERATRIQQALIHAGYMNGEPTGVWDAQSNAAMQKMQGENGWQTKITPDSRALIKLGLGGQNDATSTTDVTTGNKK